MTVSPAPGLLEGRGPNRSSVSLKPQAQMDWSHLGLQFGEGPFTVGVERQRGEGGRGGRAAYDSSRRRSGGGVNWVWQGMGRRRTYT